ncbi:hypothetical protein JWG43_18040, partial [Desulfobulbus alkaliphilus]
VLDLGGALGRGQQTTHATTGGIRQSGQNRVASPQKIIGVRLAPIGRTGLTRGFIAPSKPLRSGLLALVTGAVGTVSEDRFFTAFTVVAF